MNTLRALPGTGSPTRDGTRWAAVTWAPTTRWAALTLAPTTYWAAPDGRQFETGTAATLSL